MPRRTKRHPLPKNYGYVPDPAHSEKRHGLSRSIWGDDPFKDLPRDLNRSAFPYRALAFGLRSNPKYTRASGQRVWLLALSQGNHGSCVGWGEARKIAITLAAGHFMRGLDLTWPTASGKPVSVSPSFCYGASREWNRGSWEGSNGSWAAKATQELGFLVEKRYSGSDLSRYRTDDCNTWEARGVPRGLLQYADDSVLRGYARVRDCESLAAALQNGYAANVCGSRAPGKSTRDEYGAIALTGRWAHSQAVIGYIVYHVGRGKYKRFFIILNSHGSNRYKGPTGKQTPDLPGGAYLVSWNYMQRLLNERDTWVNFDLHGLEPASRNWKRSAKRIMGDFYALSS